MALKSRMLLAIVLFALVIPVLGSCDFPTQRKLTPEPTANSGAVTQPPDGSVIHIGATVATPEPAATPTPGHEEAQLVSQDGAPNLPAPSLVSPTPASGDSAVSSKPPAASGIDVTPVEPRINTPAPTAPALKATVDPQPAKKATASSQPEPTPTARTAARPMVISKTAGPKVPRPTATPAISTSDSASGSALHCEVDDGATLTTAERAAMLQACPAGAPVVCGTSLSARINETPAGGVLNLTGCTYTSPAININKAITIIGPTVSFPTANTWGDGAWLAANNITLDRWTFRSAGMPVGFAGVQNIQILNSRFENYGTGPIWMWGEVRNILIEGNVMLNTRNVQSGFVGGRGNEGTNPCPQVGRYLTIRGNVGDQNSNGWFGIELKCFEDVLIERNTLKGGHALISLPDSNRVTIRDNTLDLRGSAYWGVEIAKAHDVRVENNVVQGDGAHTDEAFSANSGSLRSIAYRNIVVNVKILFAGPLYADIRWNCLTNVAYVTQFGSPETSTISNNGPC